jgi:hypothetical protein
LCVCGCMCRCIKSKCLLAWAISPAEQPAWWANLHCAPPASRTGARERCIWSPHSHHSHHHHHHHQQQQQQQQQQQELGARIVALWSSERTTVLPCQHPMSRLRRRRRKKKKEEDAALCVCVCTQPVATPCERESRYANASPECSQDDKSKRGLTD